MNLPIKHFLLSAFSCSLLIACGPSDRPTEASLSPTAQISADTTEDIVILCKESCTQVSKQIEQAGGKITYSYVNVDALAVTVPSNTLAALQKNIDIEAIGKDIVTKTPTPVEPHYLTSATGISKQSIPPIALKHFASQAPANSTYNNLLTGADALHQRQQLGDDIVVAVVDTGTANNADLVPSLSDSVIGGENFVDEPNEPSATSTLNNAHGTSVSSLIAGHAAIALPESSPLLHSLRIHSPESLITGPDNQLLLPLIGTAPAAKIYAMKVFGVADEGSPRSRTIQAMDRILTLKRNFNAGMPAVPTSGDGSENNPYIYDSLNIQVANFSIGGPTLFAGQEIEDLLTLAMLEAGINVITAVGNEGFAAITGASPGTGLGSLTVGAATHPTNERVLRDLQLGAGQGVLFRPTNYLQVAEFSSRGPTADGRIDPDVLANGVATLVQRADGGIGLVSGTSLSAPIVAGAVALLRQAAPNATANQVRLALMNSANAKLIENATSIDQGNGFIDIPAALALLETNSLPDELPSLPNPPDPPVSIADTLENAGFAVIDTDETDEYSQTITVQPGETAHFFVKTLKTTEELKLRITDIRPALPAEQQNALFGDDIIFTVVDAPTSFNDTRVFELLQQDAAFTIKNPQEGILRLAILGDWTNVGAVSATLSMASKQEEDEKPGTFQGSLTDDGIDQYNFNVRPDVAQLDFTLAWRYGWLFYPAHDLDLILIDPNGEVVLDGATLDSPERVSIENPRPGIWTLLVDGFLLHGLADKYTVTMERNKYREEENTAVRPESVTIKEMSAAPLKKRLLHLYESR